MRILLIEDEIELSQVLREALRECGYCVDLASDGQEGLFKAQSLDYDVIILDLMLPRVSGPEVLQRLRKTKNSPVLVLTARDTVDDKILGFNLGADDYLTKPFDLEELIARLGSLIRRAADHPSPHITLGDIEVNTLTRVAYRQGRPVDLADKEYATLELLALNRGKLVTRTRMYEHIYGEEEDTLSNVVDVYIYNLRKKLGEDVIHTRRGDGYFIPD